MFGEFGGIVERQQALSGCGLGDMMPLAPACQPGRGERPGPERGVPSLGEQRAR